MGSPLRNGGAISERGWVMKVEHLDYIKSAKQHQEQQRAMKKSKPYQKPHHEYEHHSLSPQFDQKRHQEHEDTALSSKELDYFFWKTLVHLGWRKNISGSPESYQLMLVCQKCEKSLMSQQSHTITYARARNMSDKVYLKSQVQEHYDKCKPFEYDEDGNLVEAISEAIPEVFEKPETGTIRTDTITGNWKLFDGERWINFTK